MKREYKVRHVIRYIVTEYTEYPNGGGVATIGEFENEDKAWQVQSAMQYAEEARASVPTPNE